MTSDPVIATIEETHDVQAYGVMKASPGHNNERAKYKRGSG